MDEVLDSNREALIRAVKPLTDEQSRRRLVPSLTTPIGLIKQSNDDWHTKATAANSKRSGPPALKRN